MNLQTHREILLAREAAWQKAVSDGCCGEPFGTWECRHLGRCKIITDAERLMHGGHLTHPENDDDEEKSSSQDDEIYGDSPYDATGASRRDQS